MPQGLYLFCLARLSRLPVPPWQEQGWDGQSPLEVESFRDLAAVWSSVPVEDFCGPDAAERMLDLAWIGPRVIRHQEVVARVMRHSPVLPARFGTIFSSADRLEQVLQRHHDTIDRFLTGVTDREEWAVKGMVDRSRAREYGFARKQAQEAARLGALSPGTRYFEEQHLRAEIDRDLQGWLQGVCREVGAALRDYATEVRELRRRSREATGSARDMVVNWAFLVPTTAVGGFQARIQAANARYADMGLEFECTGPWPPYSFTPVLDMGPEA